jgi:hypothetical protein
VSAQEDYPDLAAFTEALNLRDGRRALLEIDMLRSDVAKLLVMCAKAGAEWINTEQLSAPGRDMVAVLTKINDERKEL